MKIALFLSNVACVDNISKNALDSLSEMLLTLSIADLARSAQMVLAILDGENDTLPHHCIALI